jgi:hypothetical protein
VILGGDASTILTIPKKPTIPTIPTIPKIALVLIMPVLITPTRCYHA